MRQCAYRIADHDPAVIENLLELRGGLGGLVRGQPPAAPTLPQSTRKDGAPDSASSEFSVLSSQEPGSALSSSGTDGGRPPEVVDELQAAVAGQTPDGEQAFELALDRIEQNPYQTRTEFEPNALAELAASIQEQGVLQPIVVRPATVPRGSFGLTYEGTEVVPPEIAGSRSEERRV